MNDRQDLRHNIAVEVLRQTNNPHNVAKIAAAIEAYVMGDEASPEALDKAASAFGDEAYERAIGREGGWNYELTCAFKAGADWQRRQYEPDFAEVEGGPADGKMEAAADNVVDMEQARGKAEKPAEDCNCPACQLRRMLMWGLDPSKPGSDRTGLRIFQITPGGIKPID
jgi:hypothetical protein